MLTEVQRRVIGNLSEPQSLQTLTRILRADNHCPFDATEDFSVVQAEVQAIVDEQIAAGNVTELGSHSTASEMLRAVADNEAAIDLAEIKAQALAEKVESGRDGRLQTGPLIVLSKQGLQKLQA